MRKCPFDTDSDQPSTESGIPDKNFSARNHFLNSL